MRVRTAARAPHRTRACSPARAPGRVPAGKVIDDVRPSAVYTATVAALLGIDPPASSAPGVEPLTR